MKVFTVIHITELNSGLVGPGDVHSFKNLISQPSKLSLGILVSVTSLLYPDSTNVRNKISKITTAPTFSGHFSLALFLCFAMPSLSSGAFVGQSLFMPFLRKMFKFSLGNATFLRVFIGYFQGHLDTMFPLSLFSLIQAPAMQPRLVQNTGSS